MKNFLPIIVVFFFISGCKPGIPKDIIQPEEMAKVLHDMHIADGYVTMTPNVDSAKRMAASYYKGIYKKYNIDSALYNQSLNYYYGDPKTMTDIYKVVTDQLTGERNQLMKADSLANAKIINKQRAKIVLDSTRIADSTLRARYIFRDTAKKDTTKKLEVIKSKMFYIEPKYLK